MSRFVVYVSLREINSRLRDCIIFIGAALCRAFGDFGACALLREVNS